MRTEKNSTLINLSLFNKGNTGWLKRSQAEFFKNVDFYCYSLHNPYSVDNAMDFPNTYPLDSDLFSEGDISRSACKFSSISTF